MVAGLVVVLLGACVPYQQPTKRGWAEERRKRRAAQGSAILVGSTLANNMANVLGKKAGNDMTYSAGLRPHDRPRRQAQDLISGTPASVISRLTCLSLHVEIAMPKTSIHIFPLPLAASSSHCNHSRVCLLAYTACTHPSEKGERTLSGGGRKRSRPLVATPGWVYRLGNGKAPCAPFM